MMTDRAVGIVRVSQSRGREEEEGFASPGVQRDRIAAVCEQRGLELADTLEEIDVSGSRSIERRLGLTEAIERVEAGEVRVIVVAYFDRLVRSLEVQAQILRRVEEAGGRVLAADIGEVSHDTAAQWLSATMLGMVSEYYNRSTREKSRAAQVRAISNGIPPIRLPPGLYREGNEILVDAELAPVVRRAVTMRADGATIAEIQSYLARHGIERSYHGTQWLLRSPLLVGEIRFGDLKGECPAIVDRETWERAQAVVLPRGRRGKSDRLLARLGIARCATCGARMTVGHVRGGTYPFYRCPSTSGCPQRTTISARLLEDLVAGVVRERIAGMVGQASDADAARDAEARLDRAQAELDAAIRAFSALGDEPAALDRLRELRDVRDECERDVQHLRRQSSVVSVSGADWDSLSLDGRRALVVALIARVEVAPGRGAGRVTVALVE